MIDVYSWPTPNGHKIHILLEECGLPYRAHAIDIGAGDQFTPEFLAISPNNKVPAIVDPNGPDGKPMSLFESGAILVYLASKVNRFLGDTDREKFTVLQWLMWQMGGFGPMLGQAHHFRIYAPEKIEYGIQIATSPVIVTPLRISLPSLGHVPRKTKASTGHATPMRNAGMTKSRRGQPFNAVFRYSPICAGR